MLDPAVSYVFVSVFVFVSGSSPSLRISPPRFRTVTSSSLSRRVPCFDPCFSSRSVMQLVFRILDLDSCTSVLSPQSLVSRYPSSSSSIVRSFRPPDSGLSLFSASFCLQCIRMCLMGMLGGFYVTLRASRCASTPAFSSCVRFRITSVLGNVCSQFKIHSRLCFGSMSCRGFQFFGFPCFRFSSSLLFRFF